MKFILEIVKRVYYSPLKLSALKLYTLFGPKKEMIINFKGSKMIIDPKKTGERGFLINEHVEKVFEIILKQISPNDVFVDVGAWIGDFVLPVAAKIGNGVVIAFEQDPHNLEKLRKNVLLNNFKNVTIIDKIVSNKIGELMFENRGEPTSSVTLQKEAGVYIETCTLDNVLSDYDKIDIIKIDVEGHEIQVLEGANHTLDKTRMVVLEVHTSLGVDIKNARQILERKGFSINEIDEKGRPEIFLVCEKFL